MAGRCDLCGKGPGFGHRVSHSHRLTKRRWHVNLHRKRMVIDGVKKPVRVCTQCLRTQMKLATR
jgi:large subunit ribosomal protein L28